MATKARLDLSEGQGLDHVGGSTRLPTTAASASAPFLESASMLWRLGSGPYRGEALRGIGVVSIINVEQRLSLKKNNRSGC